MQNQLFHLTDNQSSPKTEIIAGFTTFLTMAYIIFVNPSILAETGMDKQALVIVTCIVAAVSTLLMALIPKVPIAMAPGMGLNAFFAYTLVITDGVSWEIALGIVFWAGVLFLLLSWGGFREKIVHAIPSSLITAISAGIGLFLMFIGFQNMGLSVDHPATLISLGSFTTEVRIGIAGLLLTIFLYIKNWKGSILIGIVFSTLLAMICGLIQMPGEWISFDFDISPIAFQLDLFGALQLSYLGAIFTLFYIDMFDSVGTLVACSKEAKLVREDGTIKKLPQMLGVDAIATMLSGLFGTSSATSYVESASGIAEGGRTGLTSFTTGILFLIAIIFAPLFVIIPSYATAPALIMVGILMLKQVKELDFSNYEESIPAIMCLIMMPFSFSIATGLAFGFLLWGFIKIVLGKYKEVSWVMYLIMILSLINLILG